MLAGQEELLASSPAPGLRNAASWERWILSLQNRFLWSSVIHSFGVSAGCVQVEEHLVDGQRKRLLVHRKGSTRAFPPHHPLIPVDYQLTGQPVLIGGSMGTCSYVLTGSWLASSPSQPQLCWA